MCNKSPCFTTYLLLTKKNKIIKSSTWSRETPRFNYAFLVIAGANTTERAGNHLLELRYDSRTDLIAASNPVNKTTIRMVLVLLPIFQLIFSKNLGSAVRFQFSPTINLIYDQITERKSNLILLHFTKSFTCVNRIMNELYIDFVYDKACHMLTLA